MDKCQCTPEKFSEKTQQDIFDIFEYLEEGESKEINCEGCGTVMVSKINDKLIIEKIYAGYFVLPQQDISSC